MVVAASVSAIANETPCEGPGAVRQSAATTHAAARANILTPPNAWFWRLRASRRLLRGGHKVGAAAARLRTSRLRAGMKNRGQMPMTQNRTILKEFWGHGDP